MAVKEINEAVNGKRSHYFRVDDHDVGGFIRILFQGKLYVGGRDCRLKLRLNRESSGYNSYAHLRGNTSSLVRIADPDNWARESLYLGRNGWGQDADIFLDYLISFQTGYKKCGHGMNTFALSRQKLLLFSAHGFQESGTKLDAVTLIVENGGTLNGQLRVVYDLD